MSEQNEERALRYNANKTRFDLVPNYPLEQIAKVMTKGAEKYAPYNWQKGMPWSECEASMLRHFYAYKSGEDFDPETGLYHLAHAAVNLMFLVDYYRTNPQFDDRRQSYLVQPKIVLDIDEVVCDWAKGYSEYTGNEVSARYWDSCYGMGDSLDILAQDKNFWVNKLKVKQYPDFIPHAYVSSRSIPVEWTKEWLEKNGLPCRPVVHVPWGASKLAELQKLGAEIFVDDRMENFITAQSGGITTFLMDASHNQHWDVGYKRIKDLKLRNIIR